MGSVKPPSAVMKLNISYPATGAQKLVDIEDEKKVRIFYEKRMGAEVEVDSLGDEWKGYVFRIAGGNDKQGFPMKQGILTTGRVRLLFSKGHSCYRERRDGERSRKLFNLSKEDDVTQYVIKRPLPLKEGKKQKY